MCVCEIFMEKKSYIFLGSFLRMVEGGGCFLRRRDGLWLERKRTRNQSD